jgi:hypothetical protein
MLLRQTRPAQDLIGSRYAGPTHPSRASGFVHGREADLSSKLVQRPLVAHRFRSGPLS